MLEEVIRKVAKEVITRASIGPAFDVATSLKRALGRRRNKHNFVSVFQLRL